MTAKINAQIQESISGIMVAKSFRQEHAIYQTFAANNRQAYRVGLRRGLTLDTIFPIMGIASGLGVALLIFLGGLARSQWGHLTRRLVPVHAGGRLLLVAADEHRLVLEPVPGWTVGRGARLCV